MLTVQSGQQPKEPGYVLYSSSAPVFIKYLRGNRVLGPGDVRIMIEIWFLPLVIHI